MTLQSPIPHPVSYLDTSGKWRDVIEHAVGSHWPEGDEAALRALAAEWREAARRVRPTMDEAGRASRDAVAGFGGSGTGSAFQDAWHRVSSGFEVDSFERLAELADAGADVVETAKRDIYAEVTALVDELEKSGGGAGVEGLEQTRAAVEQVVRRASARMQELALRPVGETEPLRPFTFHPALAPAQGSGSSPVPAPAQAQQPEGVLLFAAGIASLGGPPPPPGSTSGHAPAGGGPRTVTALKGRYGEQAIRGPSGALLSEISIGVIAKEGVEWSGLTDAPAAAPANPPAPSSSASAPGAVVSPAPEAAGGGTQGAPPLSGPVIAAPAVGLAASAAVPEAAGPAGGSPSNVSNIAASTVAPASASAPSSGPAADGSAGGGSATSAAAVLPAATLQSAGGITVSAEAVPASAGGSSPAGSTGGGAVASAAAPSPMPTGSAGAASGGLAGASAVAPSPAIAPAGSPAPASPVGVAWSGGSPGGGATSATSGMTSAGQAGVTAAVASAASPAVVAPTGMVGAPPTTGALGSPPPTASAASGGGASGLAAGSGGASSGASGVAGGGSPGAAASPGGASGGASGVAGGEARAADGGPEGALAEVLVQEQSTVPSSQRQSGDQGEAETAVPWLIVAAVQEMPSSEAWAQEASHETLPDAEAYERHIRARLARQEDEAAQRLWDEQVKRDADVAQAAHQVALERTIERDEAGAPRRFPDLAGAWLGLVNAGGPLADRRRATNAAEVALSLVDTWLHGRPRAALPRTKEEIQELTRLAADRQGLNKLEAALRVQGHGACAVVVQEWPHGEVHATTVHNQRGELVYVDAQRANQPLNAEPVPGAVRMAVLAFGPEGKRIDIGG